MKFTREFLGGFRTYDNNDRWFEADTFLGAIGKFIWCLIYGTFLGVIFTVILAAVGYGLLRILGWILEAMFM